MTKPLVIFSHGQEGHPLGNKIVAMMSVAEELGCRSESLDYRGMEPQARVEKLLAFGQTLDQSPILVGSSLGGHVATAASIPLQARGLFLLAPAFYMPGYEQHTPKPHTCPIHILHGWNDDVVPVDHSIRYAREHHSQLTILNSDHRMQDAITVIADHFRLFLRSVIESQ